jgi:hypothetical protein
MSRSGEKAIFPVTVPTLVRVVLVGVTSADARRGTPDESRSGDRTPATCPTDRPGCGTGTESVIMEVLMLRDHRTVRTYGGSISLSPSVDMLMALGTYPATGHALARGIAAGLSVDTTTGSGTDLFTEMRLALAAERSRANADAVSRHEAVEDVELNQRDMLKLATLDAARVWHLDHEVGSITPGKQADVTVVDMRPPHLNGFGDPVTTLVMGAGAADVETVVVGGEILKAGGILVGPVAEHARELMHESRANLLDRTGQNAS